MTGLLFDGRLKVDVVTHPVYPFFEGYTPQFDIIAEPANSGDGAAFISWLIAAEANNKTAKPEVWQSEGFLSTINQRS